MIAGKFKSGQVTDGHRVCLKTVTLKQHRDIPVQVAPSSNLPPEGIDQVLPPFKFLIRSFPVFGKDQFPSGLKHPVYLFQGTNERLLPDPIPISSTFPAARGTTFSLCSLLVSELHAHSITAGRIYFW